MSGADEYHGKHHLTDEELVARYSEWRAAPSPPDAGGYLFKKAGGRAMDMSPRHSWSRRWFKLIGKEFGYGTARDHIKPGEEEDDPDDQGSAVWSGDLVTAKVKFEYSLSPTTAVVVFATSITFSSLSLSVENAIIFIKLIRIFCVSQTNSNGTLTCEIKLDSKGRKHVLEVSTKH